MTTYIGQRVIIRDIPSLVKRRIGRSKNGQVGTSLVERIHKDFTGLKKRVEFRQVRVQRNVLQERLCMVSSKGFHGTPNPRSSVLLLRDVLNVQDSSSMTDAQNQSCETEWHNHVVSTYREFWQRNGSKCVGKVEDQKRAQPEASFTHAPGGLSILVTSILY